jgi:hypothetical protein
MPARTRFRTAVRRRSCGMRPGQPAATQAKSHALRKPFVLCFVALTLLPTARAQAQVDDYDTALRAYNAAEQIQREVWMDNPNQAEAMRHAMMIARDWGIYPGFEPALIDPTVEPQGSDCIWVQDEAGNWVPGWCPIYQVYRCNTRRQIDDLGLLRNGANWFSWFYQGAAIYAGAIQAWPAALIFQSMSWTFRGGGLWIDYKIQQMEQNECLNP